MATPSRTTSPLAIASLVAGLLGWTLLPLLGSVGAIVMGHLARSEIRRAPDRLEGDGLALVGLILGYLAVAVAALAVMFFIVFLGGLAWLSFNH